MNTTPQQIQEAESAADQLRNSHYAAYKALLKVAHNLPKHTTEELHEAKAVERKALAAYNEAEDKLVATAPWNRYYVSGRKNYRLHTTPACYTLRTAVALVDRSLSGMEADEALDAYNAAHPGANATLCKRCVK